MPAAVLPAEGHPILFSSIQFLRFFAIVFALHLALGSRLATRLGLTERWAATLQKVLLLGASYVFYASWSRKLLVLIFFSSAVDFVVGGRLHATSDAVRRRRWLMVSLVANLGLLGFFKYFNFFVAEAVAALDAFGLDVGYTPLQIVLPVGISFYTFQTLSYTIDIYRRQLAPTRSALDFFLFVSFFPQLVAGPIVRASEFLPQLDDRPKRPSWKEVHSGLERFLVGLFKKVAIADVAGLLVDQVFAAPGEYSSIQLIAASAAFCFQIYADFSGYSDMAIGVARMMGFWLPENFLLPYLSCSVTEYWRRWHVSLSFWFRDYLYIPLGGNRRGRRRTLINLVTTFLLTGLWHGANWTFVMFGAWNGFMLILERIGRRGPNLPRRLLWLGFLWTTVSTMISFTIFRADSLAQAGDVFAGIFGGRSGESAFPWERFAFVFVLIVGYHVVARFRWLERMRGTVASTVVRAFLYVVLLQLLIALQPEAGAERPFIYFQF